MKKFSFTIQCLDFIFDCSEESGERIVVDDGKVLHMRPNEWTVRSK